MKKYGLLLVALLLVSVVLTACSTESADTAENYMDALLKGKVEKAQEYACKDYQDATAAWIATFADQRLNDVENIDKEVRNIDLKYDLGKGNNQEEVLVTGSFEIVELKNGKLVADSEKVYEMAASVRDKHDVNENGDDEERINTRVELTMKEEDGDWCVAELVGGYFHPELVAEEAED